MILKGEGDVADPRLWGPAPTQRPNLYVAVSTVRATGRVVDTYETPFGIRTIMMNGREGLVVNGEKVKIQGVNNHHDLGALGAAFNVRAAERQLEILREMGVNALRMSHNPPAPELLDLADRMGFVVIDEVFDSWERKKTPLDFHLIFKDWGSRTCAPCCAAIATIPRSSCGASATKWANNIPARKAPRWPVGWWRSFARKIPHARPRHR
ncbi:glycoside hydrolase family 2 TIM barrel-domain containing protein [Sphingomonas sp. 7/4-4]|uniref:glycoside hydrolase family 2 TIM barrel-domain containing protein n=1 Tax=Sphingomonas sp. 7/4-4 TaxID=3018446 RepID=UPI0022F37EAA|nr:glycoside hydrolase family 2 TIM barrel-domain containing protein [Sphingomonas sp. 7/4-4]WBY06385.1 glycoside hydrolase family 2 TIM barrel-domain containing protein [Sphingomonas sp. 7/4-4]